MTGSKPLLRSKTFTRCLYVARTLPSMFRRPTFRLIVREQDKPERECPLPAFYDEQRARKAAYNQAIYAAKPVVVVLERGPKWTPIHRVDGNNSAG